MNPLNFVQQENKMKKLLILLFVLASCGGGGGGSKSPSGNSGGDDYIDIDNLPQNTRLEGSGLGFNITDVKRININIMNFTEDFRLKYSKDIRSDEGQFDVLSVIESDNTEARTASVNYDIDDTTINFTVSNTTSSCGITRTNGRVSSVSGACVARIVLTLPEGAKIEVRNVGKLYTDLLYPMSISEFIKEIKKSFSNDNRLAVADRLIKTHKDTKTKLILTTKTLETAIGEMVRESGKLDMLSKIHRFISDRENLDVVIESSFVLRSTKEKARQIVGISIL